MNKELNLDNIRLNLIRQEETIIFNLIERSQFCTNDIIYVKNGIKIPDYNGSYLDHLLHETEKIHSLVRRYTCPEEHPFTTNLPEPIIKENFYEWPIKHNNININNQIYHIYINNIIPLICKKGDDKNYGSSAVLDVSNLQALSKRIHYGKFVAESKYLANKEEYDELIKEGNKDKILNKLTDLKIEEQILNRVEIKAKTYGQDPFDKNPIYKIEPSIIRKIYKDWVIPLTKEVQYLYLKERI